MSTAVQRRLIASLTALTLTAALSCVEGGTGVLVRFTPDPAVAGEAEVAALLATLELLIDAEGGFEGLDENSAPEGLTSTDPDGDGVAELLLELNVSGRDTLPVVRIDAGENTGKKIALQARGLDAEAEVAAYGGTEARALFVSGQVSEVEVPLLPAARYRPPRLIGAAPQGLPTGQVLSSVAFHTSRALDPATLSDRVHVELIDGDGGRQPVSGAVVGPRACAFGAQMWRFVPDACHAGSFTRLELRLDAGVADLDGRPLTSGDDTPGASVTLELDLGGFGACAPSLACDQLDAPTPVDARCDSGSGRFEPGACTLLPATCDSARDSFTWLTAADAAECQALRAETTVAGGSCVLTAPWPCHARRQCNPLGLDCNQSAGQCVPAACDGSCDDDQLACAETGCLPRIGTCVQSCEHLGGCPELGQRCVRDSAGEFTCR